MGQFLILYVTKMQGLHNKFTPQNTSWFSKSVGAFLEKLKKEKKKKMFPTNFQELVGPFAVVLRDIHDCVWVFAGPLAGVPLVGFLHFYFCLHYDYQKVFYNSTELIIEM